MDIKPPFGYKDIVPLNRTQKVRLLKAGELPEFAKGLNSIPISYSEFALIEREYPIVFIAGEGGAYAAVAVLGMTEGENLFNAAGHWAKNVYVPAYVRRFPFCMAKVTLDKVEQQNRLICIEKGWQDESGEALFDDKGQPLEKWKGIEKLLSEYEVDLERSREMCAILTDYGLLEPFTMQAKFNQDKGGNAFHLTGMHRVAEGKIEHLNASQLKNLVRKGILSRVYAHLLSLDNFAKLLDRKAARAA